MNIRTIYHNVVGDLKKDYPQDNFNLSAFIAYIIIPIIAISHSFFFQAQNELITGIVYTCLLGLVCLTIFTNKDQHLPKPLKNKTLNPYLHLAIPLILVTLLSSAYLEFIPFTIPAFFIISTLILLVIWLEGWALPLLFLGSIILLFIINLINPQTPSLNLFSDVFNIFSDSNSENIKYGIFGIAWQAMMNTVYAFLLLTAALRMIRIDKLLNFVAFRLTHGRRQGASAGLYAVIDSALYGSISGSAEDNVNKTGKYTIDLMRQSGYNHIFAASIEAVASSAGKVIPPVMGVVAFIILEVDPSISYIDLMVGSLIPAFLFLFALGVAIAIEANKQDLRPLDINYAQKELAFKNRHYDTYIQFLTSLIAGVIVLLFGMSFIPNLPLSVYPTVAAIMIFSVGFLSPRYKDSTGKQNANQYRIDLVRSLVQAGKDGVLLAISCAMIGLLLFVLEHAGLFKYTAYWSHIAQQWLTNQTFFSSLVYELFKLLIVSTTALITLSLGKHLPAIAVYLLMALIAPHFLNIVGIQGLHAHLFLLYYAVFAGLTPPFAPVLDQAARAVDQTVNDLKPVVYQLTKIMFILPIAWAFHPEIVLKLSEISSLSQDTFIVFNIIGLMLAVMAGTVASFNYFRRELQTRYHHSMLWLSAITIVLPLPWLIQILAAIMIIWILAQNDLNIGKHRNIKHQRQSFFRPAFELIVQVMKLKNIPIPTYFTFVILAIVYIGLFTINGFALNFKNQIVNPLIQDRFQVMLGVEQCNDVVQSTVSQYFQHQGYPNSSSLCTQFITQASISKQEPGEFGLINDERQVALIGFQPKLFHFINNLETSLKDNFDQEIMSYTGACFRSNQQNIDEDLGVFHSSLRDVGFNLNQPIMHTCNQYTQHQLPVVYVGKKLAEKINVSTGTMIRIHDRIYFENMDILARKINDQNAQQFFVVGAVFNTDIPEIDSAILMPQEQMSYLGFDIESRLLVHLKDIANLSQLSDIDVELFIDDDSKLSAKIGDYESYSFISADNSLFEPINNAVNTLDAIQYTILLVCLVILVSAMIQLVESQARMIALMRMSGLHGVIIWLFLFLLSSLIVTLACGLGIFSTLIIDATPLSSLIFGEIEYDVNFVGFMQLYGTSLIFAIITTILLKIQYFSHDIFRELMYASRRA
ncbi:TRAP transporter large permease subunit [Candidatus Albibeggiatoa sp. nov. NOAA]|uniref:TRAP transporter large permease subunit n=1 Tax=Candidatus Albibeggiatoa sp. nov. NOAA TaxID=3162724 RepID=UPI00330212D5|nr:TRAP transporter large permease subunit [Thiotrichaceae bacterium]